MGNPEATEGSITDPHPTMPGARALVMAGVAARPISADRSDLAIGRIGLPGWTMDGGPVCGLVKAVARWVSTRHPGEGRRDRE